MKYYLKRYGYAFPYLEQQPLDAIFTGHATYTEYKDEKNIYKMSLHLSRCIIKIRKQNNYDDLTIKAFKR